MSKSKRWQTFLLAGFVCGCVAFLALRFWPRDYVQEVLGVLPGDSAIQMYVDVPAVAATAGTVEIPLPLSLGITSGGLEAMGFSLSRDELYVSAVGRFGASLVETALTRQGVVCAEPIATAPCRVDLGHGAVWIATDDSGVVVGTTAPLTGPPTGPPTVRVVDSARPRATLASGAIVWAEINPALLDEAMEKPPANWINLQLIARALEPARVAYATLTPTVDNRFSLEVEAHCDESDAAQLARVLAGLNDMATALVAREVETQRRWGSVLNSFASSVDGEIVRANWVFEQEHLTVLWSKD